MYYEEHKIIYINTYIMLNDKNTCMAITDNPLLVDKNLWVKHAHSIP